MPSRTYGAYTVNVNSGLVSPSPVALLPYAFCRESPEVSREPRFVGATSPPSHLTAPKASDAIRRSAVLRGSEIIFLVWFFIYGRMKLSVFVDDPVIKHLVGILSHSIIVLCNRMHPSIFFNPMSEIFRGGRPGLFDDYWFSFLSHSLVSKQNLPSHPVA